MARQLTTIKARVAAMGGDASIVYRWARDLAFDQEMHLPPPFEHVLLQDRYPFLKLKTLSDDELADAISCYRTYMYQYRHGFTERSTPRGAGDTDAATTTADLPTSWTSNSTSVAGEGTPHSTPLLEEELDPDPFTDPYRATLAWVLRFVDVPSSQNGLLLAVLMKLLREDCAQGKHPIIVVCGVLCGVLAVSPDHLLSHSGIQWSTADQHCQPRRPSTLGRCGFSKSKTPGRVSDVKRGVVFKPRSEAGVLAWKVKSEKAIDALCSR